MSNNNFNNKPLIDPDEQFILEIIRMSKQESITELIDDLRQQESKSIMLIRCLEKYYDQLEKDKTENK